MRLYIEIRPGEGGDDARSLVNDQAGDLPALRAPPFHLG